LDEALATAKRLATEERISAIAKIKEAAAKERESELAAVRQAAVEQRHSELNALRWQTAEEKAAALAAALRVADEEKTLELEAARNVTEVASLAHVEAEVRAKEADKAEVLWRGGQAVMTQRSPRKAYAAGGGGTPPSSSRQAPEWEDHPHPPPAHERTPPPHDSPRARARQEARHRQTSQRASNGGVEPWSRPAETSKVAEARAQASHMSRLGSYSTGESDNAPVGSRLPPLQRGEPVPAS
jgi:hypothetical protein